MSPKCLASEADALLTILGYVTVHRTFSCTTLLQYVRLPQTGTYLNMKMSFENIR